MVFFEYNDPDISYPLTPYLFFSNLFWLLRVHFAGKRLLGCGRIFWDPFFFCSQASAFEGSIFTHSDVKPGMLVKAKVISVGNFDALVQLSSGIKVLCPLRHMSELDIAKPPKKFKVFFFLLILVLQYNIMHSLSFGVLSLSFIYNH